MIKERKEKKEKILRPPVFENVKGIFPRFFFFRTTNTGKEKKQFFFWQPKIDPLLFSLSLSLFYHRGLPLHFQKACFSDFIFFSPPVPYLGNCVFGLRELIYDPSSPANQPRFTTSETGQHFVSFAFLSMFGKQEWVAGIVKPRHESGKKESLNYSGRFLATLTREGEKQSCGSMERPPPKWKRRKSVAAPLYLPWCVAEFFFSFTHRVFPLLMRANCRLFHIG